ncbi:MarR family transcriptional regulator, partial [Halarcobacter ebronensis]
LFTGGAITKVLKKLEKKNYIIRLENEFDKRSKLVQLTSLGKETHDKVMKDVLNFEEECFSELNIEELELFISLLLKLLKK